MATEKVWNVFVPKKLLITSSVYLTGIVTESDNTVCVTGFSSTVTNHENEPVIGYLTSSETQNRNTITATGALSKQNVLLHVNVSKAMPDVPECRVYVAGTEKKCVCVLFTPADVLSSFILAEELEKSTHFESQLYTINNVYGNHRHVDQYKRHCRVLPNWLLLNTLSAFILVFTAVDRLLGVFSLKWLWSRACVHPPSVVGHIANKLTRFKNVQPKKSSVCKSSLIISDICGQQLLDSVCGIAVMLFVTNSSCADTIAASVMHWADDIASHLNDLLHWLMGAPAGLKLNAQLTEYMGHFFLYHVYLWSGYLSILRPTLGWVIWIAAGFGTLGLSTQLCLVQDIISMLTIHIYCFYVYAARLYSLQLYALSSLWRLFRGRKWNVLRLRVDSALYNVDQLCVGTLLFTVLLFLLPTTLLYYAVFALLRLLVLSFHGCLTILIDYMDTFPALTVVLRMFKSKLVAGDLLFDVVSTVGGTDGDKNAVLSMQTTHLSLLTLYSRAQVHMKTFPPYEQHKYSWGELLRRFLSGNLVYPWVSQFDHTDSKEKVA